MQTDNIPGGGDAIWRGHPALFEHNGRWFDQNGQPADLLDYETQYDERKAA